jgi:hypothetical protein
MQAHWRMAQVKAVSSGTGDLAPDWQGTGKGLASGWQGAGKEHVRGMVKDPGAPRIEPTLP